MKKKICFFIGSFQSGGAENNVLTILQNIDLEKYQPFICTFRDNGRFEKEYRDLDIPIKVFRLGNRITRLVKYPLQLIKFITFLINEKIDIVHAHLVGTFEFAFTGALFAKVKKKVITWHGIYDNTRIQWKLNMFMGNIKFLVRVKVVSILSDNIIAVSNYVKKCNCKYYHINEKKVKTVYNGIDLKVFASNDRTDIKSQKFIVGAVGNLRQEKGYHYLIEAMKLVNEVETKIKLVIAGEGLLRSDLQRKIKKNDLTDVVELLGQVCGIPDFLNTLDCWIMTSVFEGFSVAVVEAMACNLPIIVTDVGGNSEAIEDKQSGVVIRSHSVEEIKEAILAMYNNKEQRNCYAENAKQRANSLFSVSSMMEELERIYES